MYPTPHINAKPEDFASTVLMPGDPLRSKFVAETFLTDSKLINNVRGIQGYTGNYKGKAVSVMASGMGMPSIGIYSYELFNFFNVNNIIRIGTAGGIADGLNLKDIVIATGASYDSAHLNNFNLPGNYSPTASYNIIDGLVRNAKKINASYKVGNILSSDIFYYDTELAPIDANLAWKKMGILAVDMESAVLFANAARSGKNAGTILTIADSFITGEATTTEERQSSFTDMIEIALNTAIEL